MSLKERILLDIKRIKNPSLLNQVYEFVQLLATNDEANVKGNRKAIMKLSGKLSDEDAVDMKKLIDSEFNKIEGQW